MRIYNEQLVANALDLDADWESKPVWLGHIVFASIQLKFSGVPEGTFKLQISNDVGQENNGEPAQYNKVETWTDFDGSEQVVDEAGTHVWYIENLPVRWLRVVFSYTGGIGTLDSAKANVKGY